MRGSMLFRSHACLVLALTVCGAHIFHSSACNELCEYVGRSLAAFLATWNACMSVVHLGGLKEEPVGMYFWRFNFETTLL